jgi:hypothetical protein
MQQHWTIWKWNWENSFTITELGRNLEKGTKHIWEVENSGGNLRLLSEKTCHVHGWDKVKMPNLTKIDLQMFCKNLGQLYRSQQTDSEFYMEIQVSWDSQNSFEKRIKLEGSHFLIYTKLQ